MKETRNDKIEKKATEEFQNILQRLTIEGQPTMTIYFCDRLNRIHQMAASCCSTALFGSANSLQERDIVNIAYDSE